MILSFLWALPKLESITCLFSSKQPQPSISLAYSVSFLLVTSCSLLLFYFCCSTTTITTTITIVPQFLLIPLCKKVFISGAVELTTQLSKPVRILWIPKCRINKLGYLAREDYLDPLQLRVIMTQATKEQKVQEISLFVTRMSPDGACVQAGDWEKEKKRLLRTTIY